MRPSILLIFSFFLFCNLISCNRPPDIKLINTDLGISIPKNYKIIKADSDPFGLGADADIKYVFQFDSLSFDKLVKSIESSPLFNTASQKNFRTLTADKKVEIIKILAQNKMTSYWIKSDSTYEYFGNELFFNDPDNPCLKASEQDIYLPNYDKERTFQDGSPLPMYMVKVVVDRKKYTLYYNYVHT